jgi:glycosyltransferase involved in cell wall biosynthesis
MRTKDKPKQKILFVITKASWGGAQRYVYDLATGLDTSKFEVAVAVGGEGALKKHLAAKKIPVLALKHLGRDVNLLGDIDAFIELLSLIRSERPDIVHVNSSKAGILGAIVGRIGGVKKIIFTSHGWAFNETRTLPSRLLFKFIHWLTVLLSTMTIANSESTKRDMAHLPFIAEKIKVVYPGRHIEKFASQATSRQTLMALLDSRKFMTAGLRGKEALWIGTIAELHPNKGLGYLIKAVATLDKKNKNVSLIIISDGDEYDNLLYMVKSLGLEKRVFLAGFVDGAAHLLKAFDIFALPSITESFGYVLLEAGAAGLPVVASNVGGIPEIIENGKTGILRKPRDSDSFAWALDMLASNPAKRKILGENLKKKVETQFTLGKMLKETVRIYEMQL